MEEIFKYNPTLKVVFVTSDDQAFYTENDAKAYAKSLKDQTVEKIVNPSLDNSLNEEFVETPAPVADEVPAVDAPAQETPAPVADEVLAVDAPAQETPAPVADEVPAVDEPAKNPNPKNKK